MVLKYPLDYPNSRGNPVNTNETHPEKGNFDWSIPMFITMWLDFGIFKFYKNEMKVSKATCIWKFVQRHFIASKLNAGCGGYLDKIYKILVDIIDLKAGFPLANFFIQSDFFRSKTIKSRIGSFFYFKKSG